MSRRLTFLFLLCAVCVPAVMADIVYENINSPFFNSAIGPQGSGVDSSIRISDFSLPILVDQAAFDFRSPEPIASLDVTDFLRCIIRRRSRQFNRWVPSSYLLRTFHRRSLASLMPLPRHSFPRQLLGRGIRVSGARHQHAETRPPFFSRQ